MWISSPLLRLTLRRHQGGSDNELARGTLFEDRDRACRKTFPGLANLVSMISLPKSRLFSTAGRLRSRSVSNPRRDNNSPITDAKPSGQIKLTYQHLLPVALSYTDYREWWSTLLYIEQAQLE